MKKQLLIISSLTLLAVIILVSLNARIYHPNSEKNGFTREIINKEPLLLAEIEYETDIKDICGINGDTIFFSHHHPDRISYISPSSKKIRTLKINFSSPEELTPLYSAKIDWPILYLIDGNIQTVIRYQLNNGKYTTTKLVAWPFSRAVLINDSSIVVRAVDTGSFNAVFAKINIRDNTYVIDYNLSPRLQDAGFTNDGMLNFDEINDRVLYLNYYSNQLTCFDTNLNLLYTTKTIDTFNTSRVKHQKTTKSVTNARPPQLVNRFSYANNGLLYVISKLQADNESIEKFAKTTAIDIYNTSNGEYMGSFYLPVPNNEKLLRMKVYGNRCIIIYNKKIFCYHVQFDTLVNV